MRASTKTPYPDPFEDFSDAEIAEARRCATPPRGTSRQRTPMLDALNDAAAPVKGRPVTRTATR